jgi:type II secretory pathway pseudopilin PulG
MARGERWRRTDRGFTYLGLLILVASIGLLLGGAVEVASTAMRREREAQLLWAGHAYRDAIARYWARRRAYPPALSDLLGDSTATLPVRYLRRLYRDPMTDAGEWELIRSPFGGIMGVASRSRRAPLKTGGFDAADRDFADAKTYAEWRFTFLAGGPARKGLP